MAARAAVEALLRERKLDRTLTSTLPERLGDDAVAALGTDALDRVLSGGLPRGQVSEVVGPASSGRTSVAWAALAAATQRGESVALIDTFDRFDPPTAHACGIELSRLLWVRGQALSKTTGAIDPAWLPGVRAVNGPGTFMERVIDRAIKALNLVVQSGVCTMVVIDVIDVPATALRRLPASTWFRIERAIEGSDTAVLILSATPLARSAGGRSIHLGGETTRVQWTGDHDRTRRVAGVRSRAAIAAARWSHRPTVDTATTIINAPHDAQSASWGPRNAV
jgi:recombination protein RecA